MTTRARLAVPALAALLLVAGPTPALAQAAATANADQPAGALPPAVRAVNVTFEVAPGVVSESVLFLPTNVPNGLQPTVPGVVVVPEWWGLNDYSKGRAEQLAEMGYAALALDVYGDGKSTTEPQQASTWAGEMYNNRAAWRSRLNAAVEHLAAHPVVDDERLAAIGFCFGGTAALELAYDGAPLVGVVSFHGNPMTPLGTDTLNDDTASLLVLHGADDPFVSQETMNNFVDAVSDADLDWQLVEYAGAVHAFTNPGADDIDLTGVGYDEKAATRSWSHMQLFFDELFAD